MIKQLSIAAALVLAAACKTESRPHTSAADRKGITAKYTYALPGLAPHNAALLDNSAAVHGDSRPTSARADINGDETVTDEARTAARHDRIANLRSRMDLDGDGKLTVEELEKARGRMHFDDPAAIDVNHDGNISTDELAAALRARRARQRIDEGGAAHTEAH